jgi:hypothetical protein
MHARRIDEKLLVLNGLTTKDEAATNLAVVAVQARKVSGEWQVVVLDPAATRTDQTRPFGSFVEADGSLSQKAILATAERWIRESSATKRVPASIYAANDPFNPKAAAGYLLVEAAEALEPSEVEGANSHQEISVSCDTCVAACCRRGMTLTLTDKEVSQQRRAMKLQRIKASVNYARDIPVQMGTVDIAGHASTTETYVHVPKYSGVYALREHCGNLGESADGGENRPCLIHEQEGYPQACRAFVVGSPACLARRAEFGLDGHTASLSLDDTAPVRVKTWTPAD